MGTWRRGRRIMGGEDCEDWEEDGEDLEGENGEEGRAVGKPRGMVGRRECETGDCRWEDVDCWPVG